MSSTSTSPGTLSALRQIKTISPTGTRSLSQFTMGFEEIKRWKEWKIKQPLPPNPKDTIFDLKVYTPINKSQIWNIDYSEEPKQPPPTPPSSVPPLSPPIPRPVPARILTLRVRLPAYLGPYSYYPFPRTEGGNSTPQRAAFSTTTPFISLENWKLIEKGGKVSSTTAKVQNSVRHAAMSLSTKGKKLNSEEKKHNKNDEDEPPVPRYLPFFLGGGGPF
ncbi:hypothetical protein B0T21DRAFT_344015 [Apiosordaria backusii]|uniref:Uncharacterized protein n=1 Tax=Apiosordaria backusii TaxID=314023 RepID=A0AA40EZL8_9PEZI|nr:hypothetical protein B0T21DRAFT_344015 [Apiosordaria backusii]